MSSIYVFREKCNGTDYESVDTILLPMIGILIDLLKFPQFFNGLMHISENRESEKPDGLRFVRGAQFERFGSGPITPRIRVRTLFKGCAGYLTHPSNPSVRLRTCCLHPNGIPYYLIFYFLDVG
jgi:hypothetical protein